MLLSTRTRWNIKICCCHQTGISAQYFYAIRAFRTNNDFTTHSQLTFFFFVRNGTYICDVGIQFYKQFRHISVFQEGLFRTRLLFARVSTRRVGRDILVGIATRYWLDGPGIESRRGQDFPHPALGPTQPPVQRVPALSPVVKRPMQRRG